MKKTIILTVCVILTTLINLKAQKVKIEQGSLAFLKGQTEINFNFDYSHFTVKDESEKNYVNRKVKELNKEEKGSGDEWKTAWETTDRTNNYEVQFTKDFNEELGQIGLEGGYFPDAEYQATIKTIMIDPGFFSGPVTKPSCVNVEVTFKETNSNKILAKITISKAHSGNYDVGHMFTDANRIGSAYGQIGESLGATIVKALKKVK